MQVYFSRRFRFVLKLRKTRFKRYESKGGIQNQKKQYLPKWSNQHNIHQFYKSFHPISPYSYPLSEETESKNRSYITLYVTRKKVQRCIIIYAREIMDLWQNFCWQSMENMYTYNLSIHFLHVAIPNLSHICQCHFCHSLGEWQIQTKRKNTKQ